MSYWVEGIEYGEDDLPVHVKMPVNAQGQGPLGDSDPNVARVICWTCGTDWPCEGVKVEGRSGDDQVRDASGQGLRGPHQPQKG